MKKHDDVFLWRRDFRNVNWPGTLSYNFMRSAGAGIVWCLLGIATGAKWQAFQMLLFPVLYFIFLLPIGMISAWLSGLGVPYFGFLATVFSFLVCTGDPLIFMLKKTNPELIPAHDVKLFNLNIIIFLINNVPDKTFLSQHKNNE